MKFKDRNLRAIAEMVIGDVDYFPYRSSSYITRFFEECDLVIKATGQSKQTKLLGLIGGIQSNPNGTIVVNQSFHTTNPKYFAAGDIVSGGQEVVNAVADGKKAALGIMEYLKTDGSNRVEPDISI